MRCQEYIEFLDFILVGVNILRFHLLGFIKLPSLWIGVFCTPGMNETSVFHITSPTEHIVKHFEILPIL